jgi:hypothetical protein
MDLFGIAICLFIFRGILLYDLEKTIDWVADKQKLLSKQTKVDGKKGYLKQCWVFCWVKGVEGAI